jgi:integrase
VEATLAVIDQDTAVGRRDYAMLILIVLYGLRAREVAALTLDDLDWRRDRLHVPGRKAGHSTCYPLSPMAGEALIAYLRRDRPPTVERRVFLTTRAPRKAVNHHVVSTRAGRYLMLAGVEVRRPGSHTLRHSCAQRLVDADFSLKVIGDYLGHRVPMSTEIYTKVAVETLRQVALGNGEVVL